MKRIRWLAGLCVLCAAVAVGAAAPAGGPAVRDVNGRTVRPLELRGRQAAVLIFVLHDCPIANQYMPEINRLCGAYSKQKVAFYVVYAEKDLKVDAARKHAHDYSIACPALLDRSLALAHGLGARMSPEAVVVGPDGKTAYRGRIDDLYAGWGKRRPRPTRHDLRDALDAMLAHKPVPNPATETVGCFLP